MSEMIFYKDPVNLNREEHRKLRFTPVTDFRFSADYNSVPIAGIEFFEASRGMTVLFSKAKNGSYFPLVVMSLRNAGHDLAEDSGRWKGTFIPSFIRRYPFALTPDGSVCFDRACDAFSEEKGELLFQEDGKNTEMLDRILQFLNQYDVEMRRTQEFCQELERCNLFQEFSVEVGRNTETMVRLKGMYAIDEKKFAELKPKTLDEWFRKGWIGWIYAHMHSIGALGLLSRDKMTPAAEQKSVAAGKAEAGSGDTKPAAKKAPAKKKVAAEGTAAKAPAKKPAAKKAPAKKAASKA